MSLYGGKRDISFFRHVNRELISRIMCQQVVYYKFSISDTKENMYGEAKKKMYYSPIKVDCVIGRDDQVSDNKEIGVDLSQNLIFFFLRDDLKVINLVPERGDIVMWRNNYFEIDNIIENKFIVGKQEEYALPDSNVSSITGSAFFGSSYYGVDSYGDIFIAQDDIGDFGESWRLKCIAHLTRPNKLNLINAR